jgi:AbrB family looped-hinge helix DNA binding protein
MVRSGSSKIAVAERLMARPQGATMDEILAETGGSFQYNAKRRLEAKGYVIRTRREGRTTRYWARPPRAREFEVAVTSKGQLTIPKEVRERLGVDKGGAVCLTLEDDNRVVLARKQVRLADLAGMLGKPPRSLTLEEMDDAIARAVIERANRATR